MTKKISNIDISILSSYLMKAFILINGINILININKTDSIISLIIGFIIGFIFLYIYKSNDNDILNHLNKFNNKISFIIKILLITLVTIFLSQLLFISSMFVKSSLLFNVDILPISILMILSVTYLANKGIYTIVRTSFICFFILLLLEIISLIFLLPNINALKILPLFTSNITKTSFGALLYSIMSMFPLFLIKAIPKEAVEEENKSKNTKYLYILVNLYLIFNLILVLSVVDSNLAQKIHYPEMFILSKISLLDFFDRMESILSFKLLFDSFFTLSMGIYYILRLTESTFKKRLQHINLIISLILLIINNYLEYNNFVLIISLFAFGILNILIFFMKKNI